MLIQQTSRDAYASVNRGNIPMLHFVVMLIDQRGGLTCDEVEYLTDGKHQSISAAIRANVKKGLLRASGNYRMTRSNRRAIVWELTPNLCSQVNTREALAGNADHVAVMSAP